MKFYIALLRGINVGGQKKIKMIDLKQALEKNGFQTVKTYIQSGNILFNSNETNIDKLQDEIQNVILTDFGFDVPVLVLTLNGLERILGVNPFKGEPEKSSLYFVLLKAKPNSDLVNKFNILEFENENFHVTDNCVYLCCKAGYGNAKLGNNLIERKLKVEATTRNLKTMQKLVEMAKNT